MRRIFSLFSVLAIALHAAPVAPGEYTIREGDTTSYIYPSSSTIDINKIARYQSGVMGVYEREYGYRLDQRFFQVFGSHDDQVANAFSTQLPLNQQVLYGGGALHYDDFTSTSWLRTLQIHETAHNYQLNARENRLSKIARRIGGSVPLIAPFFLPMVPLPNLTENRFILEGNAVMNESRFGNGGRLYSGYALAETVVQARAGHLTPERMVNATYDFPGGEKFYLIGGHFQKFLVQRYGVRRVNGYFRAYARQPIPLFGNRVFREHYGKDFVTLMNEFGRQVRREHRDFRPTQGVVLATSQIRSPLVRRGGAVVTLVGDKRSAPAVTMIAPDGAVRYRRGDWRSGRPVWIDGQYYTQSAARISPGVVKAGLFDRDGVIRAGSEGKAVQGRMPDGRMVYFNISRSWGEPRLYVGDRFYGVVNSSVLVRRGDLYYFRQRGAWRTLYRNHTPLARYRGHDGRVVDVDEQGRVYFIAPSRHGSTAYRVKGGQIERVVPGDDVIDLKLQGKGGAVVQTLASGEYRLQRVGLQPRRGEVADLDPGLPVVRIGSGSVGKAPGAARPYSEIAQLRLSGIRSLSSWNTSDGYRFTAGVYFTDPLWRNTLSFVLRYSRERTLMSASYQNSAYPIHFGGEITGVGKHPGYDNRDYRRAGYSAYLRWQFWVWGYWSGSATLAAARPYDDPLRQPVSLSVEVHKRVQHGFSKYPNTYIGLSSFLSYDRGARYGGVRGAWMGDLGGEYYAGVRGAYLVASQVNARSRTGIQVGSKSPSAADQAVMNIPTFGETYSAKGAVMGEVALYKVLNFSAFSYPLPLSLLRESVYLKQRLYGIDFGSGYRRYRESVAGIEADALVLHRYTVPVKLEVLYNPDIANKVQFKFGAQYRF